MTTQEELTRHGSRAERPGHGGDIAPPEAD
jgi:hypothetical protein